MVIKTFLSISLLVRPCNSSFCCLHLRLWTTQCRNGDWLFKPSKSHHLKNKKQRVVSQHKQQYSFNPHSPTCLPIMADVAATMIGCRWEPRCNHPLNNKVHPGSNNGRIAQNVPQTTVKWVRKPKVYCNGKTPAQASLLSPSFHCYKVPEVHVIIQQ